MANAGRKRVSSVISVPSVVKTPLFVCRDRRHFVVSRLTPSLAQVGVDHHLHKLVELDGRLPAEFASRALLASPSNRSTSAGRK